MKKLLLVLAFVCLSGIWSGCTVTETPSQHYERIGAQWNLQMKMAVEDIDYFWLLERNSYLTEWHPRLGS